MEPSGGGGGGPSAATGSGQASDEKDLMEQMEKLLSERRAEIEDGQGKEKPKEMEGEGGKVEAKKEFDEKEQPSLAQLEGARKSIGEGERKAGEAEGGQGAGKQTERKNCVKDENGFTYYKCRFCGLTFNFMTTLKAHERVHDVVQPYTCNKCGEAFHFMCELEYHAKTHLAQKGYKCECGRTFFQYTDLLYHHHPGEDPPPEPAIPLPVPAPIQLAPSASVPTIRSEGFPTPDFMERGFEPKHQMRVWSDIRSKPYICQYCSKSYSDSRGLAYHMYSHRGERMFNPRASRYLMCRNDNSYISAGVDLRDA